MGYWEIPLETCAELGTPATPVRPRIIGRPSAAFEPRREAIYQQLNSVCRVLFVFHVVTSSSDSGALKNECLGLIGTILTPKQDARMSKLLNVALTTDSAIEAK